MILLIIEIIVVVIIFFFEDFLIYKWIRKIDKKERQFLNEWETEHITKLLNISKEIIQDKSEVAENV